MTRTMRPQDLLDSTVVDPEGSKIGKVGTVYLADDTRRPEWVTVKTGLFGHKESFVPLTGADIDEDGLHVNVAKDKVSEAPRFDTGGHLSQGDSAELYRHYGMPMPRTAPDQTMGRQGGDKTMADKTARGGKQAAAGQQGMTRSEERLNVGTGRVESGRVRLHKYVVTEDETLSGKIRKEQIEVTDDGKHRKA
jgi:hypothetical protein